MAGDIGDMGEEEIRARMELEKVTINGTIGLILSSLLAFSILGISNISNGLLILGGFFVIVVLDLALMFTWYFPSGKKFLDLARKLDRLKKLAEEGDESNKKGGGHDMDEILKKNEIRAKMDVLKLTMQVTLFSYFALALAVVEKRVDFDDWFHLIVFTLVVIALGAGFIKFRLMYVEYGKKLDEEETKERELKN